MTFWVFSHDTLSSRTERDKGFAPSTLDFVVVTVLLLRERVVPQRSVGSPECGPWSRNSDEFVLTHPAATRIGSNRRSSVLTPSWSMYSVFSMNSVLVNTVFSNTHRWLWPSETGSRRGTVSRRDPSGASHPSGATSLVCASCHGYPSTRGPA